MSHQPAADPEDARAALGSVAVMTAASTRRAAWPLWLSVFCALAHGAPVAAVAIVPTDAPGWSTMASLFVVFFALTVLGKSGALHLVQRRRGVSGRWGGRRLQAAAAIHTVVMGFIAVCLVLTARPGPVLILGALETVAIVAAFALIGRIERARGEGLL